MSAWLAGLGVIISLELRQRVRGVAWYVLLGVFLALIFVVCAVLAVALGTWGDDTGGPIYSTVVYFVLLLASLVGPALSGNAINGDRDAGTLATTQVTLISTSQLVLGKFVAAWISSLAFLAAAVPFLVFSGLFGGLRADAVAVSILVLAIELGVISAIGVGLSGLLRRPLFSIVVTYLVVALLSVGSLIAFALGGIAAQSTYTYQYEEFEYGDTTVDPTTGDYVDDGITGCQLSEPQTGTMPRYDRVWWMLAANPYVVLADAVPISYDQNGQPEDLFGYIKLGVRATQLEPNYFNAPEDRDCDPDTYAETPGPREIVGRSVPSWFVGFAIHIAMGVAALMGAIAVTRTPSRRLAAGSRVA